MIINFVNLFYYEIETCIKQMYSLVINEWIFTKEKDGFVCIC